MVLVVIPPQAGESRRISQHYRLPCRKALEEGISPCFPRTCPSQANRCGEGGQGQRHGCGIPGLGGHTRPLPLIQGFSLHSLEPLVTLNACKRGPSIGHGPAGSTPPPRSACLPAAPASAVLPSTPPLAPASASAAGGKSCSLGPRGQSCPLCF